MNLSANPKVSKAEFDAILMDYREALENPEISAVFIAMCGSKEIAEVFSNPKGVGISEFSRILDLPLTTVRHYVELGLVNPVELHGKFRFLPMNVPQIESVRQWRELGLSLEEILERRQNLGEGVVLQEIMPGGIPILTENSEGVVIQVIEIQSPEERAKINKTVQERRKRGESGILLQKHEPTTESKTNHKTMQLELQLEYHAVLEKLEAKKLELEHKIAKAKHMTEQLTAKS